MPSVAELRITFAVLVEMNALLLLWSIAVIVSSASEKENRSLKKTLGALVDFPP